MIRALAQAPALVLALSFLPGCCWLWRPAGPETLVVVVPSRHDGHVGSVVVSKGEERRVLDTAYGAARVRARGHVHPATVNAADVEKVFGSASAALPRKYMAFTLYFELATKDLTAESRLKLDQVLAESAKWDVAEIEVVGHTDRMGTPENNDALSLERAERVRRMLLERGARPEAVHAVGMGEREPVVETADGEANAQNRRVEVIIR
jgi:outer membrane protein OmpA-like peptidoglycan-associated protein